MYVKEAVFAAFDRLNLASREAQVEDGVALDPVQAQVIIDVLVAGRGLILASRGRNAGAEARVAAEALQVFDELLRVHEAIRDRGEDIDDAAGARLQAGVERVQRRAFALRR